MAKLTAADRRALPADDFAGPGRSYPIADKSHARDALSRVDANGDSALKATVRAKVKAKFPGVAVSGLPDRAKHIHGLAAQLTSMRRAGSFQKA